MLLFEFHFVYIYTGFPKLFQNEIQFSRRIQESLSELLKEHEFTDIALRHAPKLIFNDEVQAKEYLRKYNNKILIWGWADGIGMKVNFVTADYLSKNYIDDPRIHEIPWGLPDQHFYNIS